MATKKKQGQMRRLAEGVYERDGRRVVKWWEPDGKGGGKRRQETLPPGTSLADAKAFKGNMEKAKQRRGELRSETCDSFALRWPDDYPRPAEQTNMHNRDRVSKFARDFAGQDLRRVDPEAAHRWGLENKGRVKSVKAMFNDAVKYGFADENPFLVIKPDQGRGRKDIVILSTDEVQQLVQIALDRYGWFGPVVAGAIGIAAWTGMRPGEQFALRREFVDYKRGEIQVLEQVLSRAGGTGTLKTDTGRRTIAMLPQAEEFFRSIPSSPGSDLVVYTKRMEPFNSRAWHYYWDPVRTAFWAGLPANRKAADPEQARRLRRIPPDFDFYELRHHYATHLANELEATPYDIAKQMGHKDGGKLAMRLYIHTEEEASNDRIRERAQQRLAEQEAAAEKGGLRRAAG